MQRLKEVESAREGIEELAEKCWTTSPGWNYKNLKGAIIKQQNFRSMLHFSGLLQVAFSWWLPYLSSKQSQVWHFVDCQPLRPVVEKPCLFQDDTTTRHLRYSKYSQCRTTHASMACQLALVRPIGRPTGVEMDTNLILGRVAVIALLTGYTKTKYGFREAIL